MFVTMMAIFCGENKKVLSIIYINTIFREKNYFALLEYLQLLLTH